DSGSSNARPGTVQHQAAPQRDVRPPAGSRLPDPRRPGHPGAGPGATAQLAVTGPASEEVLDVMHCAISSMDDGMPMVHDRLHRHTPPRASHPPRPPTAYNYQSHWCPGRDEGYAYPGGYFGQSHPCRCCGYGPGVLFYAAEQSLVIDIGTPEHLSGCEAPDDGIVVVSHLHH